jgi:hypothetical protein
MLLFITKFIDSDRILAIFESALFQGWIPYSGLQSLVFPLLYQNHEILNHISHIQYIDILSKKRYPLNPR